MRLTLIHPCIGRKPGERYIRSWQMEPLPPATIAGLTPPDVGVRFYDDRMELIPYDEPTDLVAIVVGEAEAIWPRLVDDFRHGRMERVYRSMSRPSLRGLRPDRRIFQGKRYLALGLVEAGRGCHFRCDFCAVQAMFGATQTRRPLDEIISEIA